MTGPTIRTRLQGGAFEFEVVHPTRPDVVLWCHPCVLAVECPHCHEAPGVPCMGATDYRQGTHFLRRRLYVLAKRYDFKIPEDVFEESEARWGCRLSRTVVPPPTLPKRQEFVQTIATPPRQPKRK